MIRSSSSLRVLAFLILIGSLLTAQAPPDVVKKICEEEDGRSQVMEILDHLVNRIGPRLTSSDNLTNACEWARDKFKSFGIDNARLEEWGTFPVGFNRGRWSGRILSPESMDLEFTTSSWSAGTRGPATGKIVRAPSSAEELKDGAAGFKGAWLLGTVKGLRGKERENALVEAGVLGTITSTNNVLVHTGGASRINFEDLPRLPEIRLMGDQYKKIETMLDEGKTVEASFDVRNYFERGPIPLYNVIAEIPGTELPQELVIVGGHIDSWDGATGTTDNGTGTATTLEAARLLMAAGAKPRRTIRFMLWSGEEQGLLGSKAYAQKHPEENDRVSAVLVHDGGTNYVSGISATAAMYDDFMRILEPLFELDKAMPFKVRKVGGLPAGIGSDHDTYVGLGIPGFFWTQSGRADYRRTHHTQHDTYDAAIPEYQRHTSKVVAIGALAIANLPQMLSRENLRSATGMVRGRRRFGANYAGDDNLVVTEITAGSPAEKAGLKVKDKIVKVDGKEVKDRFDLREILLSGDAPTRKLTILREGLEVDLPVTFVDPPAPTEPAKPAEPPASEKKSEAPVPAGKSG